MSDAPLALVKAVFAQPWDADRRESLSESITPWQCTAKGATDFGDTEPGALMFPGFLDTSLARFDNAYIDFDRSAFVYVWEWTGTRWRSPDDERRLFTFTVPPDRFTLGAAERFTPPGDLSQEAKAACEYQANWVWGIMVREFNERVSLGQIRVEARARSPLEDYRQVDWDVWQHFTVVDWARGVASCQESNDRLFSTRAVIIDVETPNITIDFKEVEERLYRLFEERAAEGKPLTRDQAEQWGTEHGLSRVRFRRVLSSIPQEWRLAAGQKIKDRKAKSGPA